MSDRICKHGHEAPILGDCRQCQKMWDSNYKAKRKAWEQIHGPKPKPTAKQKAEPTPRAKIQLVELWESKPDRHGIIHRKKATT